MGNTSYSHDAADRLYSSRKAVVDSGDHAAVNAVFTSTVAGKIDPALDPKGLKIRESCDSKEHPESNAIAVFFDVTASMGEIPRQFALDPAKLPALMRILTQKNYVPDPQILFGAVGDATCDSAPIQVGQFESGLEMDDWLTKIFHERGGGGQNTESYELAYYVAARHTKIDCFEKRRKKGYLFVMGDEASYKKVSRTQVKKFIDANIQSDIALADIIAEAQKTYEVFHICVSSGSYPDGSHAFWKEFHGERALKLPSAEGVCELIVTTIGACEGRDFDEVADDLTKAGSSKSAIAAARGALVKFTGTGASMTKGTASGALDKPKGSGRSKRL